MQIHEIKREHALKKKKIVARGGKRGKTAGKGGKGQTARAGHRVRPAMRDIIKRLPKLRGHGKNRAKSVFYRGPVASVNIADLATLKTGTVVTPEVLLEAGLISLRLGKYPKIKVLGNGELTSSLTIEGMEVSDVAEGKIKAAGGTVKAIEHHVTQSAETIAKKAKAIAAKAAKVANKGKTASKKK